MRTYTRCPGCGGLLLWLNRYARTHAGCHDPHAYAFTLERQFLAAATAGDEQRATELQTTLDTLDRRDQTHPPRLGEAAHTYAQWGWPVFPLQPGTKIPYERSHGFKDATTNPAVVRRWWHATPQANIGVATGHVCDVLDVDFKHHAAQHWPDIRDSEAMPTAHGIAITPSSGLHIYLLPTGGTNLVQAGALPGIDYRGRGGYVVAPPSRLANGARYTWDVVPSPMITSTGATHG